ncbi:MAG: translocation/assembly module TamB domain-containing protein [Chitinophagaceae bacterium]|nr:translocation/assembly module TamB domain-containing protein [Chitinophagaceae bacterium]
MAQEKQKQQIAKRIGRMMLKTILFLLLFALLIIGLILTPPVQRFIRGKAVSYLEKKLQTKIAVEKMYIGLPKTVVVEGIYIEDRQQDTLFSGGSIHVDIGIWKLITGKGIEINKVELKDITAKVKRQLPDTVFNFQFIIDAFASKESGPEEETDSSATPFTLGKIGLEKIRVVYKDDVTGNDVDAYLSRFNADIAAFDLDKNAFKIPSVLLEGFTARILQVKPLATPEPEEKSTVKAPGPIALQLDIGKIDLEKIKVDYSNELSAMFADLNLGTLNIRPGKTDLANRLIDIETIQLDNTTAAIRFGKKVHGEKTESPEIESNGEEAWKFRLGSLLLNDNSLAFDDDNAPRLKNGMDYMHLKADSVTLHLHDFAFAGDSIAGVVKKGQLKEQSGFVLQQLQTSFLYSEKQAYLKDLLLKTPGTELKRKAILSYPSLEILQKDITQLQLDLELADSKIAAKDILTFVPALQSQPAFADPRAAWLLNGNIKGAVNNLHIAVLQLAGLNDTRLDVSGSIKGLPDMDQLTADVLIRNISSSRRDITLLAPANTLPSNITIPERLSISGKIKGNNGRLNTNIKLVTSLGNAFIQGWLNQLTDKRKSSYDMTIGADRLDLGAILQNKQNLGAVTARFEVKGKGYDPDIADATLSGKIISAVIKQYNYRDLNVDAAIAKQQFSASASIADPNIHFTLDAGADLSKKYPGVKLLLNIDSIKTQPLHLTKDVFVYRGGINADFPGTDPDSLQGKLFVLQSLLVHNQHRVQMDSIQLVANGTDSARYIELKSDIVNAKLQGKYKLTEMGSVMQRSFEPYFAMTDSTQPQTFRDYNFTLDAAVSNGPALKAFIPTLEKMDSISFHSHFSNNAGWNASLTAPMVHIGDNHISNFALQAGTTDSAINITAGIDQAVVGQSLALHQTKLDATLANNNIDLALNIKDKAGKEKYNLGALIHQLKGGIYEFSIKPEKLLLNYDAWTAAEGNKITLDKGDINARDFSLSQEGQELSINSTSKEANAPMEIGFTDFKIATLTGFVQPDSTLADGNLNGKITVSNISAQPVFTGDLSIENLSVKKDTVGNIQLMVDNKVAGTYNADVSITGRGNDVHLTGNYVTAGSSLNMELDIRELPLTTAQAFSAGAIRDASGSVNGRFDISGAVDKPQVAGELNFNKAAFNLSMLNNPLRIDQEKIVVSQEGIRFNRFQVKDSADNELRVDGLAATTDFTNYNFDLGVRANNFRALNSTSKDNKVFYGILYFDTDITIKGTQNAPAIDGRLKINEDTKMTVVLPQNEPGVVDREGIVVFVDKDAAANDSLFRVAYDSLNISSLQGMDISVNVEIDKAADFTLVVDEGSGDFLNVKGEAQLNTGIDQSGKVNMSGTYELKEGSYELTFNFLKRKFDIMEGSRLTWEGEPTSANVNITAKYTASTAPLDLVKNQLDPGANPATRNTYLQRLPFDVLLKMEGKLMQPKITFDIVLPDDKNYGVSGDIINTVKTKLEMLRQDDAEMNKQVFSLLLLNRFMAEDPFSSSTNTSASTLVRQSVSKLMTEQLNRLAADLIKGVDLNFDVESSDDYTTGERQNRTDLNVGLSKKLLDDRLTVTVGSNFELEGPQNRTQQQSGGIAGNVALDYRLSEDGRYMLRGYRKNEYQGIIEGYITETGLGFIITVDYNRFREIFSKRMTAEERRKIRLQKRAQKEREKNNNDPAPPKMNGE